jgi:DNA-binding response OmpR family regulator
MTNAEGQEVLVVDADPKVQRGLDQLLRAAGLLPTTVSDAARALDLSSEKYFAVALVDADTPGPEAGLEMVPLIHMKAPNTAVVVMAPRRSYEVAVKAFRAGADDVVAKTPDQVEYLRGRVVELASGKARAADGMRLVEQAAALHEELMNVLLDTHRRLSELEERQSGGELSGAPTTAVLLVEDDGWLGGRLHAMLGERGGFHIRAVATGGEALDLSGQERFHITLVKDALPDLPGSMVVRTVKGQSPDTIVLLYTPPFSPAQPGAVQIIEGHRSIPFIPEFTDPRQLAERLGELREAFHTTAKERRYLGSFRQQHFELLKRYADLRQKLQRAGK